MFKKMMKHLVNNLGLKVLAILLSIVLWMVVVKMADPDATKTFSVSVEIRNKNIITEMGKVPDIVGDSDIAVFYISGPRSYVEKMNGDDFNVTADLSQLDLSRDGETKLVPIEISPKKYDKYITVMQRTVNLQITLEDLSQQKFVITPEYTGTPAEGCAIGAVEVVPNLLMVSGPESIVSRVSRVSASINVDGVSSDVTDSVVPVLYDEDGEVISSDLLERNQASVTIKAKILGTKSVPIRCKASGTPAEGYEYRGLEFAPENVLVKGEPDLLNSLSAIHIPEDAINIDGMREEDEVVIDLNPYLAEAGVSLVDEASNQVAVRVMIEAKETKVYNFPVERINVTGLGSNYEMTYNGNSVPISVRALKEAMDALQTADIQGALDLSGLEPGIHSLHLNVTMPSDKYEVTGTVNVQVTIEDKNREEDEDGEDEGQDEGPEVSQDENQANAPGSSRPSQEDREESPGGNSSGTSGGSTER